MIHKKQIDINEMIRNALPRSLSLTEEKETIPVSKKNVISIHQPVINNAIKRKRFNRLPSEGATAAFQQKIIEKFNIDLNNGMTKRDRTESQSNNEMFIIEKWINDVLERENVHVGRRRTVSEESSSSLEAAMAFSNMGKCGLNRFQLSDFGLSGEEIDRVYRSIFVYSRGFASIMNDILAHHHEHGKNIVEKLWNLYSRVIDESNPINGVGYIQRIKAEEIKAHRLMQEEKISQAQAEILNKIKIIEEGEDKIKNQTLVIESEREKNKELNSKLDEYARNVENEREERLAFHEREKEIERILKENMNKMESKDKEIGILNTRLQEMVGVVDQSNVKIKETNLKFEKKIESERKLQQVIKEINIQRNVDKIYLENAEKKNEISDSLIVSLKNEKEYLTNTLNEIKEARNQEKLAMNELITKEARLEHHIKLLESQMDDHKENSISLINENESLMQTIEEKDVKILNLQEKSNKVAIEEQRQKDELNLKISELMNTIKGFQTLESQLAEEAHKVNEYRKLARTKANEGAGFKQELEEAQEELNAFKITFFAKDAEVKDLTTKIGKHKSEMYKIEEENASLKISLDKAKISFNHDLQEKVDIIEILNRNLINEKTLGVEIVEERDQIQRLYDKMKAEMAKVKKIVSDYEQQKKKDSEVIESMTAKRKQQKEMLASHKERMTACINVIKSIIAYLSDLFSKLGGEEDMKGKLIQSNGGQEIDFEIFSNDELKVFFNAFTEILDKEYRKVIALVTGIRNRSVSDALPDLVSLSSASNTWRSEDSLLKPVLPTSSRKGSLK